jgi:hypothetical protein
MNKSLILSTATISILLFAAERFMTIYDTNNDGTVDQSEIAAEQKRLFGAVDVDGDGKLSVSEFRRRGRLLMRAGGATLFDMLDVNGDQQVTVEELHGPKARWLKRYDTDGVAGLGPEELATALPGRQRGHHMRRGR